IDSDGATERYFARYTQPHGERERSWCLFDRERRFGAGDLMMPVARFYRRKDAQQVAELLNRNGEELET
ncbi:MAG: hypothetical protein KGR26_11825, partial [Cyanobacteria bacterium REEB65]|nr:hypothetical protein [Cyanobacteria bacterium REEB65]